MTDIKITGEKITITKNDKTIVMSPEHAIYVRDAVIHFDYFVDAVEGVGDVYDFSTPAYHKVIGFDERILFPSFPEPLSSTQQYLDFAQLKQGDVVLDLGAYSGLSAIMFSKAVGETGKVYAIEADERNIKSAAENVYKNFGIELIFAAMWEHNHGVEFSSELNMGSAVASINGRRGMITRVPSFTLSGLVDYLELKRIDFIKVDIEGAERVLFNDVKFFEQFKPRMIIETHHTDGEVLPKLMRLGYSVKAVKQDGWRFPLLECEP